MMHNRQVAHRRRVSLDYVRAKAERVLKAWARAALAENYRRAANNGRMFTSACPAFAALPGEKKQRTMASPK